MNRTIIGPEWRPAHAAGYLQVAEFARPGIPFKDIVFGRGQGAELATKALAIVVPAEYADRFAGLTDNLPVILARLVEVGSKARMVLIHQDRPVTYLPYRDDGTATELKFNVQVELPGGIQELGLTAALNAKKELLEEVGVGEIVCSAPFYHGYLANSAGHQYERYAMQLIIAIDVPQATSTQKEEGIVKAYSVPVRDASDHNDGLAEQGYLIEWAVYLAIGRLESMLYKILTKDL